MGKYSDSKTKKSVSFVVVKIVVSFNNILACVVEADTGNTLCWSSAGSLGFKGSKKSTPFAAQMVVDAVCKKMSVFGVKKLAIEIRGPGGGRESALREFVGRDLEVVSITDTTPIAHNGCRLPKRRRV